MKRLLSDSDEERREVRPRLETAAGTSTGAAHALNSKLAGEVRGPVKRPQPDRPDNTRRIKPRLEGPAAAAKQCQPSISDLPSDVVGKILLLVAEDAPAPDVLFSLARSCKKFRDELERVRCCNWHLGGRLVNCEGSLC